jgi:hypothetical protein
MATVRMILGAVLRPLMAEVCHDGPFVVAPIGRLETELIADLTGARTG